MEAHSRGHRIHYEAWGEGPPIVLVGGTLQWIERWHETGIPQHLGRSHRVVALDPLGHGRSDLPHDRAAYHESDLPDDVIAVMDAERIDRAIIWGYSRGARIAYLTAQAHPDRVVALIAGGAAIWTAAEARGRYAGLAAALRRSPDEFFAALGIPDNPVRKELLAHNDLEAVAAALEGSAEAPADIDLAAIRCPTLVYFGSLEPWAERARADATRMGAQLHVVEGAHHGAAFLAGPDVLPHVEAFLKNAVG